MPSKKKLPPSKTMRPPNVPVTPDEHLLRALGHRLEPRALGPGFRYEASTRGTLYPHLYGPLPTGLALATHNSTDPSFSTAAGGPPGAYAEARVMPAGVVVRLPDTVSFEEAACLPTAWLTAYRMLFTQAGVQPGSTVLVQGSGGVSVCRLPSSGSRYFTGLRVVGAK